MKNFIFLLITSLLFIQAIHSLEFINKSGQFVYLEFCRLEDLIECEDIFIEAFSKAYEEFTAQQLGVKDKLVFLREAFADVYDDVTLGLQKLMVAKIEGKVVGFVGFKPTEQLYQIYISQLAVHPLYWQQGIGRWLVFSVFDIFDEVESLVVIPRRINAVARNFYQKLGFEQSSYMHPGYNPERYIGYEWMKSIE